MKVLADPVLFLKVLGIYSDVAEVTTSWEAFRFLYFLNAVVCMVIPQILFLILQASNIIESSLAIYVAAVMVSGGTQIIYLFRYRRDIRIFLIGFQKFVNTKIMENSNNKFDVTEKLVEKVSRGFAGLVYGSTTFFCIVPGFFIFYAYITDNVTPTTYVAPFRDMYYFWDATKSPAFEICYVFFASNVCVFVFGYTTVAIFFFGICFYIVSLYNDLMDTMRLIDTVPGKKSSQIVSCIKYHSSIIQFTETANSFLSEVIFIQFGCSLFTIVTCVLTGSYADYFSGLTIVVPNVMCFAGTLFVFCYTGSMVLDQAYSLQLQAYSICWYDYTTVEKKLLLMLMMRTLKPCGLSAFGYFYCDNTIFSAIMSNVFSAFAFLRNVV